VVLPRNKLFQYHGPAGRVRHSQQVNNKAQPTLKKLWNSTASW